MAAWPVYRDEKETDTGEVKEPVRLLLSIVED